MSQSITLILTSNVQFSDIETSLKGKFDASIATDAMGKAIVMVAERDRFGVAVSYVKVSEAPREFALEDYQTNEFINPAFVADLNGNVFYDMTFNDRRLFDAVLEQLLLHSGTNLKRTWIDNDYGVVLPAAVVFDPGDGNWKTQRLNRR